MVFAASVITRRTTMAEQPARGNALGDAITPIVRRIVAAHPDAPARTLARRVVAECNGALTLEQARKRVRSALGLSGSKERKKSTTKDLHRPIRPAGQRCIAPIAMPIACRHPVATTKPML